MTPENRFLEAVVQQVRERTKPASLQPGKRYIKTKKPVLSIEPSVPGAGHAAGRVRGRPGSCSPGSPGRAKAGETGAASPVPALRRARSAGRRRALGKGDVEAELKGQTMQFLPVQRPAEQPVHALQHRRGVARPAAQASADGNLFDQSDTHASRLAGRVKEAAGGLPGQVVRPFPGRVEVSSSRVNGETVAHLSRMPRGRRTSVSRSQRLMRQKSVSRS